MNELPFLRLLVVLNGAIPFLMLIFDALQRQLGANSVNNALHITGILSLVFLFLSLLMTPLRLLTGWGGWIAFRRSLGLYGFFYAVVHLGIYVTFDRALNPASTFREIGSRLYLQIGLVALLLMVPLAVTSTNGMIRRLGPRRWKTLHRAAYVAAVLGVVHYYLLVKSDIRQPVAFAAVLAILLSARLRPSVVSAKQKLAASPAVPVMEPGKIPGSAKWTGQLQVLAIVQETPDVRTFRLGSVDGGPLPFAFQPGQFLNLHLNLKGRRVNRSYTLASAPTQTQHCELTIRREPGGLASSFLHDEVKPGVRLDVSGPQGRFIFTGETADRVLLIAGGVGITPVMSILRFLTDHNWSGRIWFLFSARTEHDLIFRDELVGLQARCPNLQLCLTLTRCDEHCSWQGRRGRISESLLKEFVPDIAQVPAYLCGPTEMVRETRELLSRLGVPDSQIHTEAFGGRKSNQGRPAATPGAWPAARPLAHVPNTAHQSQVIRFIRSEQVSAMTPDATILDAAEALSIPVTSECRSGICGQCRIRMISGDVEMDCAEALTSSERAQGFVLACQARAKSDLVVDL